jgi:hypothetical protein
MCSQICRELATLSATVGVGLIRLGLWRFKLPFQGCSMQDILPCCHLIAAQLLAEAVTAWNPLACRRVNWL